jgi:molybdopterin-guanine dinucleotide biosynthesis protein A
MFNVDLYVVAAGNGSRLGSHVPKALLRIGDVPCLTMMLRQAADRFSHIFVVTNLNLQDQWSAYFLQLASFEPELALKVINLPIKSGLGDGHAALQGILMTEHGSYPSPAPELVVVWGDVILSNHEIVDELLHQPCEGSGLIPTVFEANPYVSLLADERRRCISADFAKHGETRSDGLHDQSLFRFNRRLLKQSLQSLHRALWKGGRYLTPGGELSLLYSLHHLYNCGEPSYVYETAYPTLTFNTPEEVEAIRRTLLQRR